MSGLALAVALLAFLAAGDLFVAAVRPALARGPVGRAGLCCLLGPGLCAQASFLLDVAGFRFGALHSWLIAAAAIGTAGWVRIRARRGPQPAPREVPGETSSALARACVVLLAAAVLLGAAFAAITPPVKDALKNWSLRALILWHDGSVFSPDLRSSIGRHLFHPNYPLLLPLAQVFVFGLRGAVADQASKVVSSMPHLGAALLLQAFVARRGSPRLGWALAALLASIPHFYRSDVQYRFAGSIASGYGDPLFAALALGAVVAALVWFDTRAPRDAVLLAAMLGLAFFTKNEGLPLTAATGAGLGLALLRDRRGGRPRPGVASLAPALLLFAALVVPWLALRRTLPDIDESYLKLLTFEHLLAGLGRLPTMATQAVAHLVGAEYFGLVWPLLFCALVVRAARVPRAESLLIAGVLAVMTLAYAAVYLITPLPVVDLLLTSLPRNLLALAPIALVWVAVLTAPDAEREVA